MRLEEFLLARIAEDEAEAREQKSNWPYDGGWSPSHVTKVIAECGAKRMIVESAMYEMGPSAEDWLFSILALPYADHPDCREEWKP